MAHAARSCHPLALFTLNWGGAAQPRDGPFPHGGGRVDLVADNPAALLASAWLVLVGAGRRFARGFDRDPRARSPIWAIWHGHYPS